MRPDILVKEVHAVSCERPADALKRGRNKGTLLAPQIHELRGRRSAGCDSGACALDLVELRPEGRQARD